MFLFSGFGKGERTTNTNECGESSAEITTPATEGASGDALPTISLDASSFDPLFENERKDISSPHASEYLIPIDSEVPATDEHKDTANDPSGIARQSGKPCLKGVELPHGHSVGILLDRSWTPCILSSDPIADVGIFFRMKSAMAMTDPILRIVASVGSPICKVSYEGETFSGEPVSSMFLPDYFFFDVTFELPGKGISELTFVQSSKASTDPMFDDEFSTGFSIYADGRKIFGTKDVGKGAERFKDTFGRFLMGETWNMLSGAVVPSYGRLHGKLGLVFADSSVQLGIIRGKDVFSGANDIKDVGRVERILHEEGVLVSPDEILDVETVNEIKNRLLSIRTDEEKETGDEILADPRI